MKDHLNRFFPPFWALQEQEKDRAKSNPVLNECRRIISSGSEVFGTVLLPSKDGAMMRVTLENHTLLTPRYFVNSKSMFRSKYVDM